MVSKKSESISEKTTSSAATTPTAWIPPSRLNRPSKEKSGVLSSRSGSRGTTRLQPRGLSAPEGPTRATASTTMASTVVTRMPSRIAPRTRRATSTATSSRPTENTRTGQPSRAPPMPSSTGTGPTAVRRTNPPSTRPMSAMNSPMPTPMAVLSCSGTAVNTAVRNPVSTSTVMSRPSITTSPIAAGQDMVLAMPKATNALRPSPAASANGYRPTTPIRIVITPATSAVTAATVGTPRVAPFTSFAVPMMIGLSTTM